MRRVAGGTRGCEEGTIQALETRAITLLCGLSFPYSWRGERSFILWLAGVKTPRGDEREINNV